MNIIKIIYGRIGSIKAIKTSPTGPINKVESGINHQFLDQHNITPSYDMLHLPDTVKIDKKHPKHPPIINNQIKGFLRNKRT